MKKIKKILVANRGEIALRVMRSCESLGIATVAVFSDADADALFVRRADESVRLGPAPSRESYLCIDKVIDAARKTGADAIHPGYGFLSENATFAEACERAGITFVGPTARAIRAMGLKLEAKETAKKLGVPVVPGFSAVGKSAAEVAAEIRSMGFPVLVKASAGGGGKGMRVLREDAKLEEAVESAAREATSSFGDGTLLVERYIEEPRHIEIQILGDSHGSVVHLFERECSIQRRHQKIIEEAPSVVMTPELRAQMGESAVRLGKALGYSSAGTVEFIVDSQLRYYFLEVNTRLQVEHPVTEMITGLDLVAEQIRVAEGAPLRFSQDSLSIFGASIECRICAEDPAQGYLPSIGTLRMWTEPSRDLARVDSGVEKGSEVGIHYDSMLAKVITHGSDRPEAIRKMRRALAELQVAGVTTNRELLMSVLDHDAFARGELHTGFLERHRDTLILEQDPTSVERAAVAAALADCLARQASASLLPRIPPSFRNNRYLPNKFALNHQGRVLETEFVPRSASLFDVRMGDRFVPVLAKLEGQAITVEIDQVCRTFSFQETETHFYLHANGDSFVFEKVPRFPSLRSERVAGGCRAPMPGRVIGLRKDAGASVKKGETIVLIEAMKMEHSVTAPQDGIIESIRVKVGDQVDADALLAVVIDAPE